MSKKNPPRDPNKLAKSIVDRATGEIATAPESTKNPHAVALGKMGGLKGGKARKEALSADRRMEIALKANKARWGKDK